MWLLDQFNDRLLVWELGPRSPARTVPLPMREIRAPADVALGADATVYLSYVPQSARDERNRLMVCALRSTGELLWTARTDIEYFNSKLRIGPDGSLFWFGPLETAQGTMKWFWTPVTTSDGVPLSLAAQRAKASRYQPMPGDLRFEARKVGEGDAHAWRFTLIDVAGRVVRAWRVTSEDELFGGGVDVLGMVDGSPAVVLDLSRQTPDDFLWEYVAIRLPLAQDAPREISLDPHATWGDVPVTGIRLGPDGQLYQLRTDIERGVRVARYALAAEVLTPSPTRTLTPTLSPTPSTPSFSEEPSPTPPPTRSSGSAAPWLIGGGMVLLAGVGTYAWWTRRPRAA